MMYDNEIIDIYTLEQAIEDGFIEVVAEYSDCIVVATAGIKEKGLIEWVKKSHRKIYVIMKHIIKDTLYETEVNGIKVWVTLGKDEFGRDAMTFMLPEEY